MTPAPPGTTNDHASARTVGDSFTASRYRQGDAPRGLISLRALRGALRRRVWLVGAAAVAGLAVSGCLFVAAPPAYRAATLVQITNNPDLDPASQMQGDVTIAQTSQVAAGALHTLGLHESVTSFAHSYTVSALTNELLQITANAASASQAERQANALAAAFMQDRAKLLNIERQIDVPTLNQQIFVVTDQFNDIAQQITAAESTLSKSAQRDDKKLSGLLASEQATAAKVGALKYEVANYPLVTLSMIKGTEVIDPAAVIPPSRKHIALISGFAGLVAGLAVGLGVVLVDAAASDRLRRRRDIARVLGAPVKLTIGKVRTASWVPGRRVRATARTGDMPRLVAHLRSTVRDRHGTAATLALVPVGNADVAASALVSLARTFAQQGRRVVLADLADGAPAARLLKVSDPGVQFAGTERERIVVAVPDPSDRLPVGPIRPASQMAPRMRPGKALAAVYESADLLLTIASLDATFGAEFLATWTTDVVVFVTAGRSATPSLKSTGEMIRLAGMRLVSAVLVGADKSDDSLGATPASSGLRRRRLAAGSRQSVSA